MNATINGNTEVFEVLHKMAYSSGTAKCSLSYEIKDTNGKVTDTRNVLMEAINRGREDIAMAIVESGLEEQVEEALQYKTTDPASGKEVTPLRMLLKKMPVVAERVFIYCTDVPKPHTIARDDEKYGVTLHYEYLDDFADPDQKNGWKPVKYGKTDHCLNIMINSDNNSKLLLNHPLVTTLLYHKWTKFARRFFLCNLFIHGLFVSLLSSFALLILQPESATCIAARRYDNLTDICDTGAYDGQPYVVGVLGVLVLLFSLISLSFEIFQLVKLKKHYFLDWINYMEVTLFIGSILFVCVFATECLCPTSWQWQIGALCVFLAWIDLLLLIRMVPVFGIYVVMFVEILKNFLKVAPLAFFSILSFAFPFYMLFHDPTNIEKKIRTPFRSPGTTIVKTMTMVTGELEFDSLFRQDNSMDPDLQYAGMTYILWIIFIVLMPILLSNLLTGLAVDDVNEIRENAKLRSLALWVEFILLFEQLLPSSYRSKYRLKNDKKTIKPDIFPWKYTNFLCERMNRFWFIALNLSYFDSFDDTVSITLDLSQENKKLRKKVEALDCKLREVLDCKLETTREVLDHKLETTKQILDCKLETTKQALDHKLETTKEALGHKLDDVMTILREIASNSSTVQGQSLSVSPPA